MMSDASVLQPRATARTHMRPDARSRQFAPCVCIYIHTSSTCAPGALSVDTRTHARAHTHTSATPGPVPPVFTDIYI
jgi:hypothetical protein